MMNSQLVDLKTDEEVVANTLVLRPNDPVFDQRTRPNLENAINLIIGEQRGYTIPFASISLEIHKDLPEQNLFRCLFGRDALLIADLLSKDRPNLIESVISALASVQGINEVALSEEEFGRIAHEVREPGDPRAQSLMVGGQWVFPYYGSVDATLIWIRSIARVSKHNQKFLNTIIEGKEIGARVIDGTIWVLNRLSTPSGLIESRRSNPNGIENQVWKDSGDSYMHADGTLATGTSTASIETVAETFDALIAAATIQEMYPSLDWPMSPAELRKKAEVVRELLFKHMWLENRFALGTERNEQGQQIAFDSQASNQGRLLDSLILEGSDFRSYKETIAAEITGDGLLGPTGLRTLSCHHIAYRGGGYHTGSAWPMDGVFAARGLLRQGFKDESREISTRIKNSIESIGGYPEFFRGDYPEQGLISSKIIDVVINDAGKFGPTNRINQPPQLIQGWTIGAYAWLTRQVGLGNGPKK
jgi:glycogen debranching enzyme